MLINRKNKTKERKNKIKCQKNQDQLSNFGHEITKVKQ